jgi:HEAT repeat protein
LRKKWTVGHPLLKSDPEALPVLIELLQVPESDVRFIAIEGLGSLGPAAADAVPSLFRVLKSEDRELQYQAWQSLRLITGNYPPWEYMDPDEATETSAKP